MKRMVAFVLVLACLLPLSGCSGGAKGEVTLPDHIERITIARNGGPLTTFSYTDGEKIGAIAEYLSSLNLSPTKEKDPTVACGGGWTITITTEADTIGLQHYGNNAFKTADGTWWEIPYEQAVKMDVLLRENVPDELPRNHVFDEWEK